MEIGIYSFGDRGIDQDTGQLISPAERLRRLIEEIEVADQVGLDVFGIGEHHRSDYTVSAPAVVLAAAAACMGCSRRYDGIRNAYRCTWRWELSAVCRNGLNLLSICSGNRHPKPVTKHHD